MTDKLTPEQMAEAYAVEYVPRELRQTALYAYLAGYRAARAAGMERAFRAHVGLVAKHPGVPRALYHELQMAGDSRVRAAVRAMVGDYRRRLMRLFEQAKGRGELPRDLDAALATVLLIGAVQGLVIQAALAGGGVTLDKRAQPMFALLLDGYRGGRGRPRRATRAAPRTSPAVPRATR
jgi:AcrR family transcriptional regulator